MTVINTFIPTVKEPSIPCFRVKDPLSALTHFIAFLFSIIAMPFLIMKGARDNLMPIELISLSVFALSTIFLYGASSSYHSFNLGEGKNRVLRKIDHSMIGILIAGTYTPLCIITLWSISGITMLLIVWALALLSLVVKLFWIDCPKWVSSVLYLLMGWVCLPSLPLIHSALKDGFSFLLMGGIFYTAGALIYALKIPALEKNRYFKSHELFHIFIMLGTFFHYAMMYSYIA